MVRKDGSETVLPIGWSNAPKEFSRDFLQTVIDALPEAIVVIDRDHNIVLANRVAQVNQTCLKCYQCFHHQKEKCADVTCPVDRVVETEGPVRVYHTHYGQDEREISVAIDAAPIFDEAGEVVYMIEACRDVTERTLARRLSQIGNRHMMMGPLLSEYASEIHNYSRCSLVRIHILDEECDVCKSSGNRQGEVDRGREFESDLSADCICVRHLRDEFARESSPATEHGSLQTGRFSEFLATLPEATRNRLGACVLPENESVAFVPIRHADFEIGLLHVADPRPDMLDSDMLESLERLSLELGAAIHRVRIEEALHAVRGDLETRVRERTEELLHANEALQKEIIERGRLERQLVKATVREQQRIGQELHDGLGQELTGISYMAQNLFVKLKGHESADVDSAEELAIGIRSVVGQIQKIVRGLVPMEIGAAGLGPALDSLTSSVAKQTGVQCHFSSEGVDAVGDDGVAAQMYRIAQEAITNAMKHSQAENVYVTLRGSEDAYWLEVSDDGVGIRLVGGDGSGCGLRSMRYRARAIGGEIDIGQRPGGGTVVACRIARTIPEDSEWKDSGHDT